MVRLTAELIENAPQFTNAIKDRELDLHGYKFPAIENMGSTLDQFDTIDLSGNEIRKLDGFPLLKRLKSLILTNNKIVRIAEDLGQQLPYLNTLILMGNGFTELRELDPLATCNKLTFLTLTHCPVTMRANYRLYVISLLPSLRFLDYKRVTQSERKIAHSMFKRLPALASSVNNVKSASGLRNGVRSQTPAGGTTTVKTFIPGAPLHSSAGTEENGEPNDGRGAAGSNATSIMPPPPAPVQTGVKRPVGNAQDLYAIQEAIKRARTMDEVDRLHQLLSSGQFAGFAVQWQQQLRLQQQQNQQQQQQQQKEQQQERQSSEEQKPSEQENQLPDEQGENMGNTIQEETAGQGQPMEVLQSAE